MAPSYGPGRGKRESGDSDKGQLRSNEPPKSDWVSMPALVLPHCVVDMVIQLLCVWVLNWVVKLEQE